MFPTDFLIDKDQTMYVSELMRSRIIIFDIVANCSETTRVPVSKLKDYVDRAIDQ